MFRDRKFVTLLTFLVALRKLGPNNRHLLAIRLDRSTDIVESPGTLCRPLIPHIRPSHSEDPTNAARTIPTISRLVIPTLPPDSPDPLGRPTRTHDVTTHAHLDSSARPPGSHPSSATGFACLGRPSESPATVATHAGNRSSSDRHPAHSLTRLAPAPRPHGTTGPSTRLHYHRSHRWSVAIYNFRRSIL